MKIGVSPFSHSTHIVFPLNFHKMRSELQRLELVRKVTIFHQVQYLRKNHRGLSEPLRLGQLACVCEIFRIYALFVFSDGTLESPKISVCYFPHAVLDGMFDAVYFTFCILSL